MSLVELMVGITIGLFIVAAAVTLVAGQLADNRKLTRELQVQQDLRATGDIITRQLRRAGYAGVFGAQGGVANPGGSAPLENIQSVVTTPPDFTGVAFTYPVVGSGLDLPYQYQLVNGVIRARLSSSPVSGPAAWQQLTDPNTVTITQFTVTPTPGVQTRLPCSAPCPDGTSNCWPELVLREFEILIRGHAAGDPQAVRELRSHVRLRNDWVRFNTAAVGATPPQACPAG